MANKVQRIGFIGISGRGSSMLDLLLQVEGVVVPAVCDLIVERAEKGIEIVENRNNKSYPVHMTMHGALQGSQKLRKELVLHLFKRFEYNHTHRMRRAKIIKLFIVKLVGNGLDFFVLNPFFYALNKKFFRIRHVPAPVKLIF